MIKNTQMLKLLILSPSITLYEYKKEEDFDTRLSGDENANAQGGESRPNGIKGLGKVLLLQRLTRKKLPKDCGVSALNVIISAPQPS